MFDKVWMQPPGGGEPREVDADPIGVLTPLMVAGWQKCEPPPEAAEPPVSGEEGQTHERQIE